MRMNRRKAIKRALLILCLTFVLHNTLAFAYVYYSRGQDLPNLRVNSSHLESTFTTAYSNSRTAWFNTYTRANIIIDNTVSDKYIKSAYLSETYYGAYAPTGYAPSGRATGFTITLNTRTIPNNNSFRQSLIVQEFVHAFCLGYNPSSGNTSIMNYNRDRYTLISPTSDDINGVQAAYPD